MGFGSVEEESSVSLALLWQASLTSLLDGAEPLRKDAQPIG